MEDELLKNNRKSQETLLVAQDDPPFSKLSWNQIWAGVNMIFNATLSTSLSLVFVYGINLVSLAYISGLKNSAMIGGIGLGFVCSNCCAYILITSINQGVNALAAQAFGRNSPSGVALNYHRGLVIQFITIIPVIILLAFTKDLLLFFNIEPEVAGYAWDYIKWAYPSLFFYIIFDATKSYLFAQKIFTPILYTQAITSVLHIFWAWLFIVKMEAGPAGAGMAKNIFELLNMSIILYYIFKTGCCKDTWVPFKDIEWKKEVMEWEGVKKFLTFTVPIASILFLDMACYEVFSILAGQFEEDQLAVHVAMANSSTLYYSLPLGLSIAIMTFVSFAMGSGAVNRAKNYTYFGVIVNFIMTFIFVAFFWVFRGAWADLFSANENIRTLLLSILNIYLAFIFFDGLQVTLSGTLKGIGRQNAATIGLIVSYYFVALPLIYYLAFVQDMKVEGIWAGFLVGIVSLLGLYFVVLKKTNLRQQAKMFKQNFSEDIELKERV